MHTRAFVHDDFLLETEVARQLYHEVASALPIVDYHSHLSPAQVAADRRFRSITEIWLDGDHYKWRAMRASGIAERYCTGDASDWEKFEAWARAVPQTLRNPLYHWTHMELRRPFGIEAILSPATARAIFDRCNERLQENGFTPLGLLRGFRVAVVCTTDDPADSLEHHRALAARSDPDTQVYPTWRPDRALAVEDAPGFNEWIARAGSRVAAFDWRTDRLAARRARSATRRLPRRRLSRVRPRSRGHAGRRLERRPRRRLVRPPPAGRRARHARGRGAEIRAPAPLRALRPRARMGPAVSPGRAAQHEHAEASRAGARHRLRLDRQLSPGSRVGLNPRDNEVLATMIGNFQDGATAGKIQYGPAWWFLDQLQGMAAQLDALSNMGLLAWFVGMVTDSRTLLSYSRHDYFRRLLCNLLGHDVVRGLVPHDRALLDDLVRRVCFLNARDYFGFRLGRTAGV